MVDHINVDLLALEDFQRALAARRREVESAARRLAEAGARPPELGTFSDAEACAEDYERLRRQYAQRLDRLRAAIVAAQDATSTIIDNYRRAEDRNHANVADIAARLGDVAAALREESTGA